MEGVGSDKIKTELAFVPSKPGDLPVRTSFAERAAVLVMFIFLHFAMIFTREFIGLNPHIKGDWLFQAVNFGYLNETLMICPILAVLLGSKEWALPYAVAYVIPAFVWMSCNEGFFYLMPFLLFVLIPVLEIICGSDGANPTVEEAKVLNNRDVFKYITMLWAPFQLVFLAWALWFIREWYHVLTWPQFFGFIFAVGFPGGVLGINIAHELIHKNNWLEQFLGKVLLVSVCYGHFFIEHIWGHHKNVSTPHDPASSKYGENFYAFYPRTVVGSFLSAIDIEVQELKKKKLPVWSIHNRMIQLCVSSLVFAIGSFLYAGVPGLSLFLGQSFIAFSLLEIVNYIEHYGLERRMTKTAGKKSYEVVNILHSWNADARLTNYILFKLQRHSDHHAYASRRYQILRSFPESPQMPTGYAGMLCMALIPPLWFSVMNPRVEKFKERLIKDFPLEK